MNALMDSFAVAAAATWVAAFCAGAALYALVRDRNAAVWALFGAILGPIAIALLALAPPTHCPECGAPNLGWQAICDACRASQGPVGPAADGPGGAIGRGAHAAASSWPPSTLAAEPAARRLQPSMTRRQARATAGDEVNQMLAAVTAADPAADDRPSPSRHQRWHLESRP
jgi:hypothetical protein